MDDLTQQLNQILSNPQTMGQLQKLLGGGEDAAPPQESSAGTPDLSALLGALGAGSQQQPSSGLAALSPQTLTALTRLAPLATLAAGAAARGNAPHAVMQKQRKGQGACCCI